MTSSPNSSRMRRLAVGGVGDRHDRIGVGVVDKRCGISACRMASTDGAGAAGSREASLSSRAMSDVRQFSRRDSFSIASRRTATKVLRFYRREVGAAAFDKQSFHVFAENVLADALHRKCCRRATPGFGFAPSRRENRRAPPKCPCCLLASVSFQRFSIFAYLSKCSMSIKPVQNHLCPQPSATGGKPSDSRLAAGLPPSFSVCSVRPLGLRVSTRNTPHRPRIRLYHAALGNQSRSPAAPGSRQSRSWPRANLAA